MKIYLEKFCNSVRLEEEEEEEEEREDLQIRGCRQWNEREED